MTNLAGQILLVLLVCSCNFASGLTQETKPNLIVVMTDEHNFRTLGCYRARMEERQAYMWGPSVVDTPNIDWLATNGALCTSFYATTPVCSPSRASFVSGLYPQATPVVTNNIPMSDDVTTFAAILRREGYETGYAGKWHLDGAGKPQWQPERNFGFTDNRYMFNRGHWKKLEVTGDGPRVGAQKKGKPSYAVDGADSKTFTTDFLIDRTIEFVQANKDKPFCYMVSIPDPHGPDTVRAPYDTMYAGQKYEQPTTYEVDARTIPKWGKPDKKSKFGQSVYYGMVKCIDDNIGRLIETLKTEKLLDNTMIVFTSDHGDLRGEHHRQNKGVAWEGSARVPFIVYFKGQVKAGTVVDQALTSVDFAPTLFRMFGLDSGENFHGRDFSRFLKGGPQAQENPWHDLAMVRSTGDKSGWIMAVSDRYKLIVSVSDKPWLFDLKRDPDELINMMDNSAYREMAREMAGEIANYAEKYSDPFGRNKRIQSDLDWLVSGKGPYIDER